MTWNDFKKHYQDKEGPATEAPKEPEKVRTTTEKGIVKAKRQPPRLKKIRAYDLAKMKLPPITYPVESLIPEGLTIIAAPPKSGKSWLMLDMCLKVAGGEPFLGFKTHESETWYLALEDGDTFEQDRLNKYVPDPEDIPKNFYYSFEDVFPLDDGFIDQLNWMYEECDNLKVIVIDTLKHVKGSKGRNESPYDFDYRIGSALKKWADARKISIVVVTHTTQLVHREDALANVNGTNGLIGAADAVLVIAKDKRTDVDAVLAIDGRRVRQAEHEIRINRDTCRWEYIGVADPEQREREKRERELQEIRESSTFQAVLKVADHYTDGWEGGAKKLINDAAMLRAIIKEPVKEVGGMLTNHIALFAEAGVKVQVIKNGTAANLYKISMWEHYEETAGI